MTHFFFGANSCFPKRKKRGVCGGGGGGGAMLGL